MKILKFIFIFLMISSFALFIASFFSPRATNHFSNFQLSLDTLSRALSRSYWQLSEPAVRIFSPYTPGKYGQNNTLSSEYATRALASTAILPLAPAAYLLGNLSLGVNAINQYFSNHPYIYMSGNATEKKLDSSLTLLSMNICFLPGALPNLYGGVDTANERVERLAKWLIEQNSDILCLFEANDVDALWNLYNKLKDQYAHFYFNIGPHWNALNSGIFIASKYSVDHPQFTPYELPNIHKGLNKGFFDFDVISANTSIAHIFATHLQTDDSFTDVQIRAAEMHTIVDKIHTLDRSSTNLNYPIIVCGDLNMPLLAEYKPSKFLNDNFTDTYSQNITQMTPYNSTATDYLQDLRWNSSLPNVNDPLYYQIIDYILLYNNGFSPKNIQTAILPAFDLKDPLNALSDHQALKATIQLK